MNRQSGQSTLEYMFILFMGVAVVIALAAQFYRPLGEYYQNFFGDYLQCLLEAGELPTAVLGGDNIPHVCDTQFAKGLGKKGRSATQQEIANNNNPSDENSATKPKSSSSSSSTPASSRSGSTTPPSSPLNYTPRGSSAADGQAPSNIIEVGKVKSDSNYRNRRINQGRVTSIVSSRSLELTMSKQMLAQLEKESEKKKNRSKVIASDDDGDGTRGPQKFIVKQRERKVASTEDKFDLSFGNLFRIGLIILLILFIIFLVGRQALQVTKDWEK